jgi:spermidine/putrescine transport system permease protein
MTAIRTPGDGPTWLQLAARLYVVAIAIFIFLPVAVLVLFSFQDGRLPLPPFNGPSLRWYAEVLSDRSMLAALGASLAVGVAAAGLATVLSFLAAYGVARHAMAWRGGIEIAMLVPASVSYLIVGLGLSVCLNAFGIRPSLGVVVIGHTVVTLPIAFSLILSQMDPAHERIEMAARDLGASDIAALRDVTVPIMLPAILAAFAITFSLSWDEFIIAFLLTRFEVTLPVEIWTSLRSGLSPFINASGTLIFLISLAVFLIFVFGLRRKASI